jgi:DNA-directed RNA polymerase subunit RPC12/RpoP
VSETKPQLDPRFLARLRELVTLRDGARCPRCRYDLNGLIAGRCPECGKNVESYLREYDLHPERFGRRRRLILRALKNFAILILIAALTLTTIIALDRFV